MKKPNPRRDSLLLLMLICLGYFGPANAQEDTTSQTTVVQIVDSCHTAIGAATHSFADSTDTGSYYRVFLLKSRKDWILVVWDHTSYFSLTRFDKEVELIPNSPFVNQSLCKVFQKNDFILQEDIKLLRKIPIDDFLFTNYLELKKADRRFMDMVFAYDSGREISGAFKTLMSDVVAPLAEIFDKSQIKTLEDLLEQEKAQNRGLKKRLDDYETALEEIKEEIQKVNKEKPATRKDSTAQAQDSPLDSLKSKEPKVDTSRVDTGKVEAGIVEPVPSDLPEDSTKIDSSQIESPIAFLPPKDTVNPKTPAQPEDPIPEPDTTGKVPPPIPKMPLPADLPDNREAEPDSVGIEKALKSLQEQYEKIVEDLNTLKNESPNTAAEKQVIEQAKEQLEVVGETLRNLENNKDDRDSFLVMSERVSKVLNSVKNQLSDIAVPN